MGVALRVGRAGILRAQPVDLPGGKYILPLRRGKIEQLHAVGIPCLQRRLRCDDVDVLRRDIQMKVRFVDLPETIHQSDHELQTQGDVVSRQPAFGSEPVHILIDRTALLRIDAQQVIPFRYEMRTQNAGRVVPRQAIALVDFAAPVDLLAEVLQLPVILAAEPRLHQHKGTLRRLALQEGPHIAGREFLQDTPVIAVMQAPCTIAVSRTAPSGLPFNSVMLPRCHDLRGSW